jgi:error-prone DNA polymerase
MSMLPRLRPRCWYDLVIEVSIVRPGPIQGGMVHPYLRRRNGEEPVTYAHRDLQPILYRTLGVPLFQEQVMAMAMAVGGYSPGQADQLRRAMGAWRKKGGLEEHSRRLIEGMTRRGIPEEYAQRIALQIQGFGEYGFPESHAASFARLVYVSCWLKRHFPAAFTASLINSQPMGFYSPRALVADARRKGIEVRPIDVLHSRWDCTLEPSGERFVSEGRSLPAFAIRLGLRLVKGLHASVADRIEAARTGGTPASVPELARVADLRRAELGRLARAGALASLEADRRQALWTVEGLYDLPLFRGLKRVEEPPPLEPATAAEALQEDFRSFGLSIEHDPVRMAREVLRRQGVRTAEEILGCEAGKVVKVAGLVSNRQRPGTASGVVFMTLEDETGLLNLVIKPPLFERQRALILETNLLRATARVQRDGAAVSLLALSFAPFPEATPVASKSRDFH